MRRDRLLLALLAALVGFQIGSQEERGNRAYRGGEYREAIERYRTALARGGDTPRLHYNLGTTLLEIGELEDAGEEFAEALQGHDPELRGQAFYNLGNVAARSAGSGGDPQAAKRLEAAIRAYRRSLLLQPGRHDARWNLELALQRLKRLEDQQRSREGEGSQPLEQPDQPGGQERMQPGRQGQQPPAPRPGPERLPPQSRDSEVEPLSPNLAEQILRAVEEQERGLQREKLRGQNPARRTGPDW